MLSFRQRYAGLFARVHIHRPQVNDALALQISSVTFEEDLALIGRPLRSTIPELAALTVGQQLVFAPVLVQNSDLRLLITISLVH